MIKVLSIQHISDFQIELTFSNDEQGVFDAASYLSQKTGSLLVPLRDANYFKRCFVEAGAICWPNGLELSGERLFELCQVLEAI